jgi:hypothetical protein
VRIRLRELQLALLRVGVRLPGSEVLPIALDSVDEKRLVRLATTRKVAT